MKAKKYMIVGIIVLLISLVGSIGTYAWFTWSSTNNTSLTMSIGELADVIFSSGNDISTNALAPVFNYTDGERTTFIIRNKSDSELKYKVLLNITSIEDELKSSSLKYKLLSGNNVVIEGDFSNITSNSSITLYESTLTKGNISFIFYLYIDGNEENDLNMMGKNITGNIMVEANAGINFAEYITNLYTDASKTTVTNNSITYNYATSVNLMNDRLGSSSTDIEAGNIRYYGTSPNNYIYFNCDDYSNQTSSTCEVWRIIGVFEGKVKIMRENQIGTYSWDNKNTSTGTESAYGKNDWTTARLMKLLNPSDYYEVDSNDNGNGQSLYWNSQSGTCFAGQNNATVSCNFTGIGLKNDTTRNMISEETWYLKGCENPDIYVDKVYNCERTTGSIYNATSPTTWTGKIALTYPSDYGYATDLNLCKKTLYNYNDSTCTEENWMKSIITNNGNNYGWLLTPFSRNFFNVWFVKSVGNILNNVYTYNLLGVTPTLYLDSKIKIKESTTGSSSNPYQLIP
mgnify:CR=1 FL=1